MHKLLAFRYHPRLVNFAMRPIFEFLKRPAVTLWLSIGLLVAYPLSVGPALLLMWKVSLPKIAVDGFRHFYSPLASLAAKSRSLGAILEMYADLWVDSQEPRATEFRPWPDPPPFFIEVSGAIAGAWIVWSFIRWLNQRKVAAL